MNAEMVNLLGGFLLALLWKATLLLASASVVAIALRRASAALRHLVWLLGLGGLLVLPIAMATLPSWHARFARQPALFGDILPAGFLAGVRSVATEPAGFIAAPKSAAIERASSFRWPIFSMAVWFAGSAVFAARTVCGLCQLPRLSRRSTICSRGSALASLLDECAAHIGIRGPVELRIVDRALAMPMTWGCRRPIILIPPHAVSWGIERSRAVLLHELAHVRRGDWPGALLSAAACALFWFHPLVWIAAKALRYESERAADDTVIRAGMKPARFSAELLAILQSTRSLDPQSRNIQTMIPAIPMAQPATVERRIRALLDQSVTRRTVTRLQVIATLTVAAALLLPLATLSLRALDTSNAQGSSGPELSARQDTPETAVKSFIDALNRRDIPAARRCIFGANPSTPSAEIARAMKTDRSTFAFADLRSVNNGRSSAVTLHTVTLTDSENGRETRRLLGDQRLELRRDDGVWRIIPADAKSIDEIAQQPELTRVAAVLAASDAAVNSARAKAQAVVCVNHLRQLAVAAHMYANDHGGRLDFAKAGVMKALGSYAGGESIFRCPESPAGALPYVFNAKLREAEITRVAEPNRTVFFYEGNADSHLAFPHQDRAHVVFVDGHVEMCAREDAAKLRWDP
jgi:prepilin-type processing-associated H-X9-DG protein